MYAWNMKSLCVKKEIPKCFDLVDTFGILGTYWYFHRKIAMIGAAMEQTPICQKANETLSLIYSLFYIPKILPAPVYRPVMLMKD